MQFSYKLFKCFPDIYNMSTQKQAPLTVTPFAMMRHRTGGGGGICYPGACAEFHVHIRDTSPDSDVRLSGIRVS